MVAHLAPIADETRRLLAAPDSVDAILRAGAEKAAAIATPIADEAERLVGFLKV
jgi:tryptophanyl-tRNA synthetase